MVLLPFTISRARRLCGAQLTVAPHLQSQKRRDRLVTLQPKGASHLLRDKNSAGNGAEEKGRHGVGVRKSAPPKGAKRAPEKGRRVNGLIECGSLKKGSLGKAGLGEGAALKGLLNKGGFIKRAVITGRAKGLAVRRLGG